MTLTMRKLTIGALAFVCCVSARAEMACTFVPHAGRPQLKEALQRRPGGAFLRNQDSVRWKQADGDVVTISHGGCEDLVTGVSLRLARPLGTAQATAKLVAAIGFYWDRAAAESVAAALARTPPAIDRTQRGEQQFQYPGVPVLDATLILDSGSAGHRVISIIWTDA